YMRLSQLFGKTQREIPAEADTISHQLMIRSGMIRQLTAGVYSYLPLALGALRKIENIVRDEMDKAGGQEVCMPVLQPIELWERSGRGVSFGKNLFRLFDRKERELALGPTHEEVVTDLVSHSVQSYRDLPLLLYQIQTKFRDEPRPRGGLVRVREFVMKDLYSFDINAEELDKSYQKMLVAYKNIYARCGLPVIIIEADSGAIGGKDSNEFMAVSSMGEDEIIYCEKCGNAANAEKAKSIKKKANDSSPLPMEEVATPGYKTIEEVSGFLKISAIDTLKAVFYMADGEFIFVTIRGDLEINEVKLKNLLQATDLRLATETEVSAAGIVAGSASAVGLKGIKIVADESVTSGTNFVAGANKADTHLRNVNYIRDFKADIIGDIALSCAGDLCIKCDGTLSATRGVEVGHVFKLGTFLSEKMGAYFIDANGESKPIVMGCYGIGIGRLMAAIIEMHKDEKGIIWPLAVAPYQVYLCPLFLENQLVAEKAESLYKELEAQGLEVLYDDRNESTGVKFNDADLLGIPLRVTISPRSLEKSNIEIKWRSDKKAELVPVEEADKKIKELLDSK
ncbi:MAG: proline--tRNA ligase, partial [Dehalococcoidales bacterium]|nr:proline--tRNA ligase [Dehalococcoidales bacterium]